MSEPSTNHQKNPPQRKLIRLDQASHQAPGTCASVTIATADRHPVFVNTAFTDACVAILPEQAEQDEIDILAYCFIPDHLHLLVQGSGHTNEVDFSVRSKGAPSEEHGDTDYPGDPGNGVFTTTYYAKTRTP